MMRIALLSRTAACVAAIAITGAATGAACAADVGSLTQSQGKSSQADPPCRGSGLSDAPFGVAEAAPGQAPSARPQMVGGYASPKDVKLIFACPNRLVPTV